MNEIERLRFDGRSASAPAYGFDAEESEAGLRDYLRLFRRNWKLLVGTVVLVTVLAVIVIFQLTPQYRAGMFLVMDSPKSKVAGIESVYASGPLTSEALQSEIEIIRSRRVARRVIETLKLDRDPEFNTVLQKKRLSDQWISQARKWITDLFSGSGKNQTSPEVARALGRVRITDALLNAVDVNRVPGSNVIEVAVVSIDAQKATTITNKVAEIYLIEQVDAKLRASERATKWLRERIVKLRLATETAERAVATYRSKHGLIRGRDDRAITSSQIAELSTQLIRARTKRVSEESRLARIERLLRSKRGIDTATEVLSSQIILRLSERESELIGKLAENSAVYGPKHPIIRALRAEMADLRRKIRLEARKIVGRVRGEVEVARAQEAALQQKLTELEKRVGEGNQKSVKLRALERDAQANRALLESVLTRHKEATAQQAIQSANVRIVSYASVPTKPHYPNKTKLGGLALFGGILLGFGLIALKEKLDVAFRSTQQVEKATGLAVLDVVPQVRSRSLGRGQIANYLKENQISSFAEAFRGIYMGLLMSNVDHAPKLVLITSSVAEEGKSLVACALAEVVSASGSKVLILDCDLRRPTIHEYYGFKKTPGLVEFLSGQASLDDVIMQAKDNGPHILPAGRTVSNPSAVLTSQRMKNLLDSLRDRYDFVIVDSAPTLAVNDSRALGAMVDAVLFAVRWGKVRRDAVVTAVKKLDTVGLNVAGIVFNRVDRKKHTLYDGSGYDASTLKYEKYDFK